MEQNSSEEGELFDTKTGSDSEAGETGTFNHVPESPGSDSPISDNRGAEDLTTPTSKGSPKAGRAGSALAWLLVWVVACCEQAVDERCCL